MKTKMFEMPKYKPVLKNMSAVQGGKIIHYYDVKIPQNEYREKYFECSIDTVFSPENQQPVSEIHSLLKFSVLKKEVGNAFQTRFIIHSTDVSGTNQEVFKLLDLNQLLSIPTKEIVCLLNSNGSIKEVLNTDQIHKKWKEVFEMLKRKTTDEQFLTKISDTGEKEFSNPMSGIEKTQLYNLFFFPLFNRQFEYGKTSVFQIMEASHLLNEQTLDVSLLEKYLKIDNSYVNFHFDGSILNSKELFSKSKKIFGNLLNQNSTYKGEMSVEYQLNAEYGYPILIKSKLREMLVGAFLYEQKMEIKEINS